jgi:hypothetical protein
MSSTMDIDWAAAWQEIADDADNVPEAAMAGSTKTTLDDTRKWWTKYVTVFIVYGTAD